MKQPRLMAATRRIGALVGWVLCLAAFLLPGVCLAGRTIRVPEEFFTIQEALDAAGPGDHVVLSNAIYRQAITLRDGVTLESEGGRDSCRIIPPAGVETLVSADSLSSSTILRGIALDGKKVLRRGIYATNSRVEILDCSVHDMNTGIWMVRCADGLIARNDIHDCSVQGIGVEDSSPEISGNTFRYNPNYSIAIIGVNSQPLVGGSRGRANHFQSYKSSVDLGNGTPNRIDARYNAWGEATTVEMNSKGYPANISVIEDHDDDPSNGHVDYRHWDGQPFFDSLRSEPLRLVLPAILVAAILIGILIRVVRGRARVPV